MGDTDQGAVDQGQLNPRTRSHTADRQLQKVCGMPRCYGARHRVLRPSAPRNRHPSLPGAVRRDGLTRRMSSGRGAVQLPLPGVERGLRNAFLSAKCNDRQAARRLSFRPLSPLIPKNLIHFSCHDWVASRSRVGKKELPTRLPRPSIMLISGAYDEHAAMDQQRAMDAAADMDGC